MRLGIIGLGRAGRVHLAASTTTPGIEVVAMCDPAPAACDLARQAGIHAYANLPQMLERERLEAVAICVPPADHAAATIACLKHGLHVLCEKPLALSTWEAMQMLHAAQRHGRLLVVASKFRHVPAVRYVRDIMRGGELGELVSFEVNFCSPVGMAGRWNAQRHTAGGGVVTDNGAHVFDVSGYLFGSITQVHATLLKPLQPLAVEDSATLRIETERRVIGTADISWSLESPRDSYIVVHGARGTAEIGWRATRLKRNGQGWCEVAGPYDKVDAHRRMHAVFRDAVCKGGEPWISAAESFECVAATEAAYRSVLSGRWEAVLAEGQRGARMRPPQVLGRQFTVVPTAVAASRPDAA